MEQQNLSMIALCDQDGAIAPKSLQEMMDFATFICRSDLVPTNFRNKPADIIVAWQLGAELGITLMQSLRSVASIEGKPCVYGDLGLALVRRSGKLKRFKETWDPDMDGTGGWTCYAERTDAQDPVENTFSLKDARDAGLFEMKDGRVKRKGWRENAKRQCKWRARWFTLRDLFPDVLMGIKGIEEMQDSVADDVEVKVLDEDGRKEPGPVNVPPAEKPSFTQAIKKMFFPQDNGQKDQPPEMKTATECLEHMRGHNEAEDAEFSDLLSREDVEVFWKWVKSEEIAVDFVTNWLENRFGVATAEEIPKDQVRTVCENLKHTWELSREDYLRQKGLIK